MSGGEVLTQLMKFDKNKDGRVHKIEFWAAETHFWGHERDADWADYDWNYNSFNPTWY